MDKEERGRGPKDSLSKGVKKRASWTMYLAIIVDRLRGALRQPIMHHLLSSNQLNSLRLHPRRHHGRPSLQVLSTIRFRFMICKCKPYKKPLDSKLYLLSK